MICALVAKFRRSPSSMLYGIVLVLKMFGVVVELVSCLFNRLNDELLSLMVTVFRSTWLRMNKVVFEEQFSSSLMVFTEASKYIEDFRPVKMKEQMVRAHVDDTLNSCKFGKFLIWGL
jgi:hypothetical protein